MLFWTVKQCTGVAQIEHLSHIPRLLEVAAAHCGQLFNTTQIGAQLSMDARTVEKYLGVLEKLFLVQRLPAWGRNELGRLVKTPKLHFLDAGLQATLTRLKEHTGKDFIAGIVLYDGDKALPFGEGMWAVPLAAL